MGLISEKLDEAESILRSNGIADPRREAALLMCLALDKDKTFLIAHPEYALEQSEAEAFGELVQRRASHEPYQYIAGHQEFYGIDFLVTPDVLIPRPETEMIVERAIEILGRDSTDMICEIGVGSGCIVLSILHEVPGVRALGLDVSEAALGVAKRNADLLGLSDRITFRTSNVYSSLSGERFGMIVSNPPYVPTRDLDGLQAEVRDFEPHTALFGGEDGLSILHRIIDGAPSFLVPRGYLLLEIGFSQSEQVAAMFETGTWDSPALFPDLQGIPRLVVARLK